MSQRPTLVIGYGAFGLKILRSLLLNATLRGILKWDVAVQNLVLLSIPDVLGLDEQQLDPLLTGQNDSTDISEMLRDLYRQIQTISEKKYASFEQSFVETVDFYANILIAAHQKDMMDNKEPMGLDVVVIVHPSQREVIGQVDRLMRLAMEKLKNNRAFTRGVSGSEVLNFIEILDFQNYWDNSSQGKELRHAIHASINTWQKRYYENRDLSFGRVYLVDSHTLEGHKDEKYRIQEISLFLEFLLFEDQRNGALNYLYQSPGARGPILATFGIRLIERSIELLRKLSGAYFGHYWLYYLDTGQHGATAREFSENSGIFRAQHVKACLEDFYPEGLDKQLKVDIFKQKLEQTILELKNEFKDTQRFDIDVKDWMDRIEGHYETVFTSFKNDLLQHEHEIIAKLNERLLQLSNTLQQAIYKDLHHITEPSALSIVIAEIEALLNALEKNMPDKQYKNSEGDKNKGFARLKKLYDKYFTFKNNQLNPRTLSKWWLVLGFILSLGTMPFVYNFLIMIAWPEITLTTSSSVWDRFLYYLLQVKDFFIKYNVIIPIILAPILSSLLKLLFHKNILKRIKRATDFYLNYQKGRVSDVIYKLLEPKAGQLYIPLEYFMENLLNDLRLSVRNEVSAQISWILTRLKLRQLELRWLTGQLKNFLSTYNVHMDSDNTPILHIDKHRQHIRYRIETNQEFQEMLARNPIGAERFQSEQSRKKPFEKWEKPYSSVFLSPLEFIDKLSEIYQDFIASEISKGNLQRENQAEDFINFIKNYQTFNLGFTFLAQEGVPVEQRYCLLPRSWHSLPNVVNNLAAARIIDENIIYGNDTNYAYLLKIQIGIDVDCLK